MNDGGITVSYVFFGGLLLLESFLFGFDSGLNGLSFKEISEKSEEGDKKARRLRDILLKPQIYNNTFQLIITLIHLIMGGFFLIRVIAFGRRLASVPSPVIPLLATAGLMYILLTFGMLIPRKLAAKKPDQWAWAGVNVVTVLMIILRPLTGLVGITAKGLLWIAGIRADQETEDVTEEGIISMVNEGQEQGVLLDTEAEMITNIIEFGDKVAKDIMTQRKNILAIDNQSTLSEAVDYMLSQSKSRFPVYEDNIDMIAGILHLRDAMRAYASEELRDKPIAAIDGPVREAVFIPETKKLSGLFQYMQQAKTQMVIVIDEYGQTVGLIAMEDILEEIVGNIMDEYDEDEDYIESTDNQNEYIIEGKTPLEELEEWFGISFHEEEFETLNGFLISRMDKIPDEDEMFDIDVDGYNFKILTVENKMITSVKCSRTAHAQ